MENSTIGKNSLQLIPKWASLDMDFRGRGWNVPAEIIFQDDERLKTSTVLPMCGTRIAKTPPLTEIHDPRPIHGVIHSVKVPCRLIYAHIRVH